MKAKHLVVLVLVLMVLGAAALIKKRAKTDVPTTETLADLIEEDISSNAVSRIEVYIEQDEEQAEVEKKQAQEDTQDSGLETDVAREKEKEYKRFDFVKKNNKWAARNFHNASVLANKIDSFLGMLDSLEGELRSTAKDIFGDYGIADDEGVHIVISSGPSIKAHVVLGTKKAGWRGNFVRQFGSNDVYYVEENLLSKIGFSGDVTPENFRYDRWLDKSLFSMNEEDIAGLEIAEQKDGALVSILNLAREDIDGKKKWSFLSGYSILPNAKKIKDYVKTLTGIKANKIVSAEGEYGFDGEGRKLTLKLSDNKEISLIEGSSDENGAGSYVKISDKQYVCLVPNFLVKKLFAQDGDFFVDNPLGIEIANINRISISDKENGQEIVITKEESPQEGQEEIKEQDKKDEEESQDQDKEPVWKLADGKEVPTALLSSLFGTLERIKLQIEPGGTSDEGPAEDISLRLTIDQGDRTKGFSVGAVFESGDEEYRYFRIDGDNATYRLEKEKAFNISMPLGQLYKEIDKEVETEKTK